MFVLQLGLGVSRTAVLRMRGTVLNNIRSIRPLITLIGVLLSAPGLSAQESPRVVVYPVTGDSVVFDAQALARLPRAEVNGSEHGRSGTFAGVALQSVLTAAGVRVDSLRGQSLRDVAIVEAADGYRVAFSLAELATDLGGLAVLVADRRDGAPLAESEGPLRLVVASDNRPARWVRQVRVVRVVR